MRSGKLARRLLPALFLCGGSALAGDPAVPAVVTPPPLEVLVLPGVPVGTPTSTEPLTVPPRAVLSTPAATPAPTYTVPAITPAPVSVYPTQFPVEAMFANTKDKGPGLTWVRAEILCGLDRLECAHRS